MSESPCDWRTYIEHAALSDVGMRRTNNQDSYAVVPANTEESWLERGHVFLVADGMGAHAAGERASEIAAETFPHTYLKLRQLPVPEAARAAVEDANQKIHSRGQADPEFQGMGTTSSALLLLPQGAVVAHVGDSRVYRLRGKVLEQLTFDHSLVWEMTHTSKLRGKEIPSFIPKNVITRSLGPNAHVEVDLEGPFPIAVGDTYLLCSDGLTGPVKDEELGGILACLSPEEAVRALVDLANLRGGPDNISVIVVRVRGPVQTAAEIEPLPAMARPQRDARRLRRILLGSAALVACVAAAVTLLAYKQLLFAGIAALAAGATAAVLRFKLGVGAPPGESTVRYGRGPHMELACPPGEELVERLSKVVTELRAAAQEKEWTIKWSSFDTHAQRAHTAQEAGRHAEAVRELCRAISFLMSEVRGQRTKNA